MIIYQRKESMDSLKNPFNQWELKPLSNQIIDDENISNKPVPYCIYQITKNHQNVVKIIGER